MWYDSGWTPESSKGFSDPLILKNPADYSYAFLPSLETFFNDSLSLKNPFSLR